MQVFILQHKTKLVLVPPFFKPIAPFGWSKSCKKILLILCKSLISPSCYITLSKNTPHPKQPVPVRLPELLIRGQCFLTQLSTFAQCYLPFVGVLGGESIMILNMHILNIQLKWQIKSILKVIQNYCLEIVFKKGSFYCLESETKQKWRKPLVLSLYAARTQFQFLRSEKW